MITNLDDLKSQIDIHTIISHYLPLKKNGANYICCCPFHGENTASFVVSVSKQIYHCFGCDAGGDAIKFVKEYKNIGYVEALQEIAGIIGFTLTYSNNKYDDSKEANEAFLNHCIRNSKHIEQIVFKRGFNKDIIESFSLGYSGESLEIKKLYNDLSIPIKLGILHDTNNGVKSMFARRLIIPIFNANGNVVGFSGRAIDFKANPKYINSKEGSYQKKHILYGFNIAKKYILEKKEVIITEGYFDVMALHALDFKHSVGVCGIALTKEHIALIKRYDNIAINLAFDNDNAGREATKRAIKLLIEYECYKSYVIKLESKQKDFNDIMLHDRLAIQSMKKIPIIIYILKDIHTRLYASDSSIEERSVIVKEVKAFLESIKDSYIQKEYLGYARELFGFDFNINYAIERQEVNINNINYDLTLARVLKASFNNKEYTHILKTYTNKNHFLALSESYVNCIEGRIDSTLEHIIFNDIYILDYNSLDEFLSDLNSIRDNAKKLELDRYLKSNASINEKISYANSMSLF